MRLGYFTNRIPSAMLVLCSSPKYAAINPDTMLAITGLLSNSRSTTERTPAIPSDTLARNTIQLQILDTRSNANSGLDVIASYANVRVFSRALPTDKSTNPRFLFPPTHRHPPAPKWIRSPLNPTLHPHTPASKCTLPPRFNRNESNASCDQKSTNDRHIHRASCVPICIATALQRDSSEFGMHAASMIGISANSIILQRVDVQVQNSNGRLNLGKIFRNEIAQRHPRKFLDMSFCAKIQLATGKYVPSHKSHLKYKTAKNALNSTIVHCNNLPKIM